MIRFPRMHIAESVVNRILNADDELGPAAPVTLPEPTVADPTAAGVAIDAKLSQPASSPAPQPEDMPNAGATIEGEPLLNTILTPNQ